MPHFVIQYSANLESRTDIQGLCEAIHAAALETGLFEVGAIRARAFAAQAVAIADLDPRNGFVDCVLRMGQGRTAEDRKQAGEAIFAAMQAYLKPLYDTPYFALSFSIEEIDSAFSWKKNGIHPRLRNKD